MPERVADDFVTIRERLEQIKKEREEAQKTSNAPVEQSPVYEGDYCVGLATQDEMLYMGLMENVFEDYQLNEADEIIEDIYGHCS